MMEALEAYFEEAGIAFSATWARMRCMPHTVHLSALQVRSDDLILGQMSLTGYASSASRGNWCHPEGNRLYLPGIRHYAPRPG